MLWTCSSEVNSDLAEKSGTRLEHIGCFFYFSKFWVGLSYLWFWHSLAKYLCHTKVSQGVCICSLRTYMAIWSRGVWAGVRAGAICQNWEQFLLLARNRLFQTKALHSSPNSRFEISQLFQCHTSLEWRLLAVAMNAGSAAGQEAQGPGGHTLLGCHTKRQWPNVLRSCVT